MYVECTQSCTAASPTDTAERNHPSSSQKPKHSLINLLVLHRIATLNFIMLKGAASTLLSANKATLRSLGAAASTRIGSVRNLNVHEHISMELMNEHGIATPKGCVAFTAAEAKDGYMNKMANRT